jgi:hypothetical protein
MGPVAARAQQPPISAADFLARIDRARAIASGGLEAPSESTMDAVRSALALPVAVRLGRSVVSIEHDHFLERLNGSAPAEYSDAIAQLDSLAAALREAEEAPPIDPARVRDALTRAYRDVPRRSIVSRYLAYAREFVGSLVSRWIESLDTSHGFGSILAWTALLAIVAAVVAFLRRLGIGFVPEPTARAGRAIDPVDWRAASERALRAGDATLAVIALYHVLLEALTVRGVISGDPAVTSGECRAAVARAMPGVYGQVASATESFERVAYGGGQAEPRDVEALRTANRAVGSA